MGNMAYGLVARADVTLTLEEAAERLAAESVSRFERGANWPAAPRLVNWRSYTESRLQRCFDAAPIVRST
ncbi:hypothetical protein PPMP20_29955 [Paraburkholderia phymatum]|uniref:hypothetical protein n=1 Tax=Paraburkholderia phymatum TaxID=148447 RepID=UPI00059EF43F|nr:hypothetical protein [Paraburkholderia phymatum]